MINFSNILGALIMSNANLEQIYKQASNLSYNDQLELISKLTASIKSTKSQNKHKLCELKGLGKDLWEKINSDQYLKSLREEWNDR